MISYMWAFLLCESLTLRLMFLRNWEFVFVIICFDSAVNCVGSLVFGRPYYRSSLWYTVSSVCRLSVICDVLYCGETVRPSEKLYEEVNRKSGSKSWLFGSPPYFYFRFRLYGHFCLIFARTAQRLVLDGTNGLSSSKPYAYCWILQSELKPEVVLATIIDLERCK